MGRAINIEAFVALWNNHAIPIRRIADALGVSVSAVSDRARRLGLPSRKGVRFRKHDPDLLREMWLAGVAAAQMAEYFGFSHESNVGQAARRAGLPRRERSDSGPSRHTWPVTLSVAEFFERGIVTRMAAVADRENAARRQMDRRAG